MSETKFEVEIDNETGLPVVPEGFFWRVGQYKEWEDDPYVFLMEHRLTDVRKEKKFLGLIPTGGYKYVKEMGDVRESSRSFKGWTTSENKIPPGARLISQNTKGDYFEYSEPVNDETIRARAIDIMVARHEADEAEAAWNKLKAEREAVKDKYYGDYPPKSLVG
jgi:hypothetical protein